jgi:hypothetical protein
MSVDPDVIEAIQPDENVPPGKLPFGIVHALNSAGITTYAQLSNYSPEAIMLIPGMTRAAVSRIRDELKRRNLNLGPLEMLPGQKTPPEAAEAPSSGGWHAGQDRKSMPVPGPTEQPPRYDADVVLLVHPPHPSQTAALLLPPPGPVSSDRTVWRSVERHHRERATLRDRFAMAALTGLLSSKNPDLKGGYRELNIHEVCENAYALADGMMKAREKK